MQARGQNVCMHALANVYNDKQEKVQKSENSLCFYERDLLISERQLTRLVAEELLVSWIRR